MTAPAEQPAQKTVPALPKTDYVVLTLVQAPDEWKVVGQFSARDQSQAIKLAHEDDDPQVYVAVPARSWSPTKITPRVTFDIEEVTT